MTRGARFILGLAVSAAAVGAVPAAALAGSISGTVTAETGGAPIAGAMVCQYERNGAIEESCTQTAGNGGYAFGGLPAGSYVIGFSGQPGNLKWVDEIYNDKRYSWEADLVTIGSSQALGGVDAALAEGGSISGTVSDETTALPIAGIWACAIDHQGIPSRCSASGPNGEYQLNGLRSGEYSVELEGGNRVNYLHEFYEDAETWAEATGVAVTAPAPTTGIDAELAPGAQILGHVGEIGTGAPLADIMVCALELAPGEYEACDYTDSNGGYAIRSIPAGTYLVAFAREYLPFGVQVGQWWNGVSTAAEATPITIAPPETRSGIDGQVHNLYRGSKPESAVVSVLPTPREPPAKCRKGFHRKKAHGKSRCVRKHKKARSHKHSGPTSSSDNVSERPFLGQETVPLHDDAEQREAEERQARLRFLVPSRRRE